MNDVATQAPVKPAITLPGWDALWLALLVFALLMITGFAESSLGNRFQDVARHPFLGQLLPAEGVAAMGQIGPRPAEPLGLVLFALTLGLLGLYFLVDLLQEGRWQLALKAILLGAIILTAVYLPTVKLMLLDAQGPRGSYSHDGGVLQTEATIDFLLQGKNPYVEDYTQTPMATWGHPDFRTALYHYPYLPWTFIFSAPFYIVGKVLGFYDQRLVYLLLMTVALLVTHRLAYSPRAKLAVTAAIGLNPLMALDLIFGQNDVFVLCWLLFSLVAWQAWVRRQYQAPGALLLSLICFGLACASKPTAWFFAPFYGLLLLADQPARLAGGWSGWFSIVGSILWRSRWALAVFGAVVLPYLFWNPFAFYDDVWRWSNGQGETGYQIWGWGASNFVLAWGWVNSRFAQWPFWQLELLCALPVLLWFLHRQRRHNALATACWHYGVFLFVFFYSSRFLNENYLSYILPFLCLGVLTQETRRHETGDTIQGELDD
jgi:hypothetical protein